MRMDLERKIKVQVEVGKVEEVGEASRTDPEMPRSHRVEVEVLKANL